MEVTSLDSPGASSGYCSGTDEDLASVCDSGLAPGYPDSLYHCCSSSSPFDPDRLDSLIGSSPYDDDPLPLPLPLPFSLPLPLPGVTTYEAAAPNGSLEFPDLGITERNFRELWRSWFLDDDSDPDAFCGVGGIMPDFFQTDFTEPVTRLFSDLQEKDEEPSRLLQFLDASETKDDVVDIIANLPTVETNGKGGDNSPEEEEEEEEDWRRMFSAEEWDCLGSTGMMSLQEEECLYPLGEFRDDVMMMDTVINIAELSNDDSARNTTTDSLNKDGRTTITNTGIHRRISGPEAPAVQVQIQLGKTSGGPDERPRSFPSETRTDSEVLSSPMKSRGPGLGQSTTSPEAAKAVVPHPAVRFDGLEDHRYSSRAPGGSTASTATPCSVLEALLRTSGRLNPNKGSAVIFCREIKRRNAESATTMQPSNNNNNRQPRGATRATRKHRSTLLHSLLTCRMEEVEKNRRNIRGGRELERRTQVENARKTDLSRSEKGLSFDAEETIDSYSRLNSSMAWSDGEESRGDTGLKMCRVECSEEEEEDAWFNECFCQTS